MPPQPSHALPPPPVRGGDPNPHRFHSYPLDDRGRDRDWYDEEYPDAHGGGGGGGGGGGLRHHSHDSYDRRRNTTTTTADVYEDHYPSQSQSLPHHARPNYYSERDPHGYPDDGYSRDRTTVPGTGDYYRDPRTTATARPDYNPRFPAGSAPGVVGRSAVADEEYHELRQRYDTAEFP